MQMAVFYTRLEQLPDLLKNLTVEKSLLVSFKCPQIGDGWPGVLWH